MATLMTYFQMDLEAHPNKEADVEDSFDDLIKWLKQLGIQSLEPFHENLVLEDGTIHNTASLFYPWAIPIPSDEEAAKQYHQPNEDWCPLLRYGAWDGDFHSAYDIEEDVNAEMKAQVTDEILRDLCFDSLELTAVIPLADDIA